MKKWVIIAILSLLSLSTIAQNGSGLGVGIRAGVNLSDFTSSTGRARAGFAGGLFLDYNISRFGFELGVNYSEQGSLGVVQSGTLGNSTDFMLDYVNAQLLVKYQVFNGFRIFIGPQASYLVSSIQMKNGRDEPINYINAWDYGVRGGVGFTFKFGLDISASYNHGFSDIFLDDRTSYTSMFTINLGWRFSLAKKKK